MKIYAHPFSLYCWKALAALYEADLDFEYRNLEDPGANAELAVLWPMKRFPVLVDRDRTIVETTAIIEHLAAHYPSAAPLIPSDPDLSVECRMLDRIFDNYVTTPQGKHVFDVLRPEPDRDPYGVQEAKKTLDIAYAWLDDRMKGRTWAIGEAFTLADCAAGPALFYADWTYEIPDRFETLKAYRARLLARPSIARCVDDARPYRAYFPLGAPDRD
ncbi:MAG: glutathione S-transferase family protein [Caulobacteraceae bacterium]|nr:MAG: glutathione S-transferase family protein [Caulobacteraceae bacterium]